MTYKVIYDF